MKRILTILACAGALVLAACTGDTNLPEPTGKGGVRAINAIPGSPVVTFSIEERALGQIAYKNSSAPALYDDFEYNFNFDIDILGEEERQRIASVATQVVANNEHVFVLSGDLANPTVTTWAFDLRDWNSADTVFEARFAHLAESLGMVDVYIYEQSAALPVQGEQVATLSYGEIMDAADFEGGTYKVLVTAPGDIGMVHYESIFAILNAQSSQLFTLFDGNENDTGPYLLTSMSTSGQEQRLPDPAYAPTVRFVHGARTLPTVDIYRDETLTDLVASNIALGDTTADLDTVTVETTWYFTPTGSTATVLFDQAVAAAPFGTPTELYLVGDTDAWSGVNLTLDRSSASTLAKVSLFHSAFNTDRIDMYIVERDTMVAEDASPTVPGFGYGLPSGTVALVAGSYDVYLMEATTKNVIAGPYALDVALGDAAFLLGIDSVNPGMIDILDVSLP